MHSNLDRLEFKDMNIDSNSGSVSNSNLDRLEFKDR